jgi:hydroxymethylglutaryl-CoA synthase
MSKEVGIIGYGVYLPKYRIKSDEYIKSYGYFAAAGINEKSIARFDEDILTMALEAANNSLLNAGIEPNDLDAIYLGTTSAPYEEKMISSTLSSMIGAVKDIALADFTTSTKAGTTAFLTCVDFIMAGRGKYGMAIASDSPISSPLDDAEHPCGAGAAAFVIGTSNILAKVESIHQLGFEMWGGKFRRRGERFSTRLYIPKLEQEEYLFTISSIINKILKKVELTIDEIDYIVFHQPDMRMIGRVRRRVMIKDEQISPGIICTDVGDVGAASALLGLASTLDIAKIGNRILVISHGSGTGADAFILSVCKRPNQNVPMIKEYLDSKEYIDYMTYLRWRRFLERIRYP